MNNLYGNIFHFWGDYYDKTHLDKACIKDAYAVIVIQDLNEDNSVIEDGTSIKIVRMIEQFY